MNILIEIFVQFVVIHGRIKKKKMIVELLSFSLGALNGFAIASLILTLIDRRVN
jgi:hypothetical protein